MRQRIKGNTVFGMKTTVTIDSIDIFSEVEFLIQYVVNFIKIIE